MSLPRHYVHLIEAMPDGVVVTDHDGVVVYANGLLEKLSGYGRDDLLGHHIEKLVPSAVSDAHVEHRRDYYAHGRPVRPMGAGLDIRLRRDDGVEVPVDIALSTLAVDDATFVLASVRDVSDRLRAEAAILENERRWREVFESVQLGVVGLDRDGRVTYANPYLLRLTGFSHDEVVGTDWFDTFVPEHERQEQRSLLLGSTERIARTDRDDELVTRAGARRKLYWFHTRLNDADGTPIGTISIGEDVTDRRRVTTRARALNEVAQAILTGGSSSSLLHQVASSGARLLDADAGALIVPLDESRFEVLAAAGEVMEGARGRVLPSVGPLVEDVVATGRSRALDDVSASTTDVEDLSALGNIGPALVVPLWVRGDPFGALIVANAPGGRTFDLNDVAETEAFASQAAVALAYERAQHEVRRLGVLAERERIARELHDTVIQRLFAAGMRLQAASTKGGPALEDVVQHIVEDLDGVIRDIRTTIFTLRSAHETGFRAAVIDTALEAAVDLGFEPQVRFGGTVDSVIGDDLRDEAIVVLGGALGNVARHAGALHAQVEVTVANGRLTMAVVDDGAGFPPDAVESEAGLTDMRARAERLGGGLQLSSRPGGGTVLEWWVPLAG